MDESSYCHDKLGCESPSRTADTHSGVARQAAGVLGAADEAGLGDAVRAGEAAKELLRVEHLGGSRRSELQGVVAHGERAAAELIEANLWLVEAVARRYRRRVAHVDLVQEGTIGLIRAVQKFDPDRGRLSTYAVWWIRQSILSRTVGSDGSTTLGDLIEDRHSPSPPDEAVIALMAGAVAPLLAVLDQRERDILRLRFGLGGVRIHTLAEIGALLGLTRQRVGQIEARALSKLRRPGRRAVVARELLSV